MPCRASFVSLRSASRLEIWRLLLLVQHVFMPELFTCSAASSHVVIFGAGGRSRNLPCPRLLLNRFRKNENTKNMKTCEIMDMLQPADHAYHYRFFFFPAVSVTLLIEHVKLHKFPSTIYAQNPPGTSEHADHE